MSVILEGALGNPSSPSNYAANTYVLTSTLNVTQSSSHTLTIEAQQGTQPVISGGVNITGWVQYSSTTAQGFPGYVSGLPSSQGSNIYVAQVPPTVPGGTRYPLFRDLFVNGQQVIRARTPALNSAAGNYSVFVNPALAPQSQPFNLFNGGNGVQIAASAVPSPLLSNGQPGLGYPDLFVANDDVEMVTPFQWGEERLRIAAVYWGPGGQSYYLKFGSPEYYIPGYNAPSPGPTGALLTAGYTFYLENALAFLTGPGEWFEDINTGTNPTSHQQNPPLLYYWPRSAGRGESSDAQTGIVMALINSPTRCASARVKWHSGHRPDGRR